MSLTISTSKLLAANVTRSGLGFLGVVVFARLIGAGELGVYFLFLAVIGICSIAADFGINAAVKKRISEGEAGGEHLTAAILLKLGFLVAVSGLALLFGEYLTEYVGANVVGLLILTLFVQQYAKLMVVTMHGELRVGETAHIEVVERVVWLGLGTLFVSLDPRAVALIHAYVLAAASKLVLAWIRKDTTVGVPRVEHVRSVFDYSKFSVISSVGGYLYSWLDVLIIGYFLAPNFVGAYEVAWRLTSFVLLLSRSVSKTIFPQISEWSVENATEHISAVISRATLAALIFSVPAFFGVLVLSAELLGYLFGAEYVIASAALVILMFEKVFQSVHKVWGYSLQAIDRPDQAAVAATISIVVNVALNLALVPRFELVGAASATAASFLLNTALHAYYLKQSIPLRIEWYKTAWCVLASTLMFGVVYALSVAWPIDSLVRLLLFVAAGAVTYFAIVPLYSPLRTDISSVMNEFRT